MPEIPQASEGVTYAKKIRPGEARIKWTWSAVEVDQRIRGLSPFPGAWFQAPSDKGLVRVKALLSRVEDGEGAPGRALDDGLLIACGGRPYNGFQLQADQPTVQGSIERALLAFCGEDLRIIAAGRTDTGVHATAQVIHVDLAKDWRPEVVRDALNAHLVPEPIAVLLAEAASSEFHARFSATGRRYLYRILNRQSPPALDRGRVWHVKKQVDAAAMHKAAQVLVGQHDFTTFRDAACQAKSPVKTLDAASVVRDGEAVMVHFAARSFLHRQVRSMTGSLVEVGLGRWSVEDLKAALEAKDRKACGPVAPADGLYLTEVVY